MTNRRIAVLGAGNMGRALIAGLLRSGTRAEALAVADAFAATRESLARELGVTAGADNHAAVRGAQLVVLAVKPYQVEAVLKPLAAEFQARPPLLISIAAGIRLEQLAAWAGAHVPAVRAMPNRPALLGAGVSGLYAPPQLGAPLRGAAEQLLAHVGEVVWVEREELIDAVTAVSGSGPAYFFLLAELMAEAGRELGLSAPAARRLAMLTLYGAGLMAHEADADLARLREQVTSPGGTTAAALKVFADADLAGIVARALGAAARRGAELTAAHH
jgi:pyrroline-5-carboxylate reductase